MSGRAFGKVILLGEHAVVHGVPALAAGIDRGAAAVASRLGAGLGASTLTLAGTTVSADDGSDLARAFAGVLAACGATEPMAVSAETDLPAGAGLGCSAALGVAIARAVDDALGHRSSSTETFERATAWERVFHGNPSGVDATVAAAGGCIRFVRGRAPEPVRVARPLMLAVGYTGLPSSTKTMVEAVARLKERRPSVVEKAFDGVRTLVENARLAVEAGDVSGLGKLLDLNQMILSGLFVSSSEIERMCDLARGAGALGAKLTGAGGGGCVIALVSGGPEEVLAAWKREGFDGFSAVVHSDARREGAEAQRSP